MGVLHLLDRMILTKRLTTFMDTNTNLWFGCETNLNNLDANLACWLLFEPILWMKDTFSCASGTNQHQMRFTHRVVHFKFVSQRCKWRNQLLVIFSSFKSNMPSAQLKQLSRVIWFSPVKYCKKSSSSSSSWDAIKWLTAVLWSDSVIELLVLQLGLRNEC